MNEKVKLEKITMILVVVTFLLMFITMSFIPVVSASLPPVKQHSCVEIKTILNATKVNISSLSYPNTTVAISNTPMTKIGYTFNYTFCSTNLTGTYIYDYNDEAGNVYVNDFEVTYTGRVLSTEETYIYILALFFLLLLVFGLFFVITTLPSRDATDEEGFIKQVSMLKHLRFVLWSVIWILCVAMVFIIANLGIAYLSNAMIGNLFFNIYKVLFYFTIIAVPVYFCWIFYKVFQDKKMKEMMDRGLEFRGDVLN